MEDVTALKKANIMVHVFWAVWTEIITKYTKGSIAYAVICILMFPIYPGEYYWRCALQIILG